MKRQTKLKHADQTLKRMILEAELAPAAPVLTRDSGGDWWVAYGGVMPVNWQYWSRSSLNPAWTLGGTVENVDMPATDSDIMPDGTWWQMSY